MRWLCHNAEHECELHLENQDNVIYRSDWTYIYIYLYICVCVCFIMSRSVRKVPLCGNFDFCRGLKY